MLGRRSLAALLVAVASPAAAQTPASDVPPALRGKWTVTFADGGTSSMVLEARNAIVDAGVAYVEGKFLDEGPMELKVWLTPAAISPPVPGSAWSGAVQEKGGAFPGLLPARLSLAYDRIKDEMNGSYYMPEIDYDKPTGKYRSTQPHRLDITLRRTPVRGPSRGMAGLP